VSPDIRQNDATERNVGPLLYLPYSQEPGGSYYILLHATANPIGLADPFRNTVAEVDRHLPVQDLMLLEQRMERSRWAYPLFGTVFSVFAAIALILSAAGVFALVAASVRRRIPEFGIRLALGASQILGSMLIGVDPSDAVTVGAVSCFLLAVALVTCWLPARRVMRIHPITALRHE
jgi:ABC-type antimicrobial peptide transport system permease subunit